ncbi:MAG: hypothetical protein INR62_01910 [Rhodospirillales bacterium]|nr:hypothetical protein [Acetobacter sp.]
MSMPSVNRRHLCLGGAFSLLSQAARPVPGPLYLFETADTRIRLTLEYYDQFERDILRFRETGTQRAFCGTPDNQPASACPEDFHGSLAIVHYQFVGLRSALFPSELRELVREVDRSEAVLSRPPFERAIRLQDGVGSDIQAFGLAGKRSVPSPGSAADPAWFVLRQDLFLGGASRPFLVLHWCHQMSAIRVLDLLPGPGTRQVFERSRG